MLKDVVITQCIENIEKRLDATLKLSGKLLEEIEKLDNRISINLEIIKNQAKIIQKQSNLNESILTRIGSLEYNDLSK